MGSRHGPFARRASCAAPRRQATPRTLVGGHPKKGAQRRRLTPACKEGRRCALVALARPCTCVLRRRGSALGGGVRLALRGRPVAHARLACTAAGGGRSGQRDRWPRCAQAAHGCPAPGACVERAAPPSCGRAPTPCHRVQGPQEGLLHAATSDSAYTGTPCVNPAVDRGWPVAVPREGVRSPPALTCTGGRAPWRPAAWIACRQAEETALAKQERGSSSPSPALPPGNFRLAPQPVWFPHKK